MASGFAHYATENNDPLLSVLNRICLSGWQAGVGMFDSPWAVDVPAGYVSFYVVASGNCRLRIGDDGGPGMELHAGDHVLLARGPAHRVGQRIDSPLLSWRDALLAHDVEPVMSTDDDEATTVLCGYLPPHPPGREPLPGLLPDVLQFNHWRHPILRDSRLLVKAVSQQRQAAYPGWHPIAGRMIQVLLLQMVRAHIFDSMDSDDVEGRARWLSASVNDCIGPVLAKLHETPEQHWTVHSLARQAHMAKSAFSQRFRETVGRPPLQYLTAYRMDKACEMLLDTDMGIAEIAASVGYDSASSFSNAFKRWRGAAPAVFRKDRGAARDAQGRVAGRQAARRRIAPPTRLTRHERGPARED